MTRKDTFSDSDARSGWNLGAEAWEEFVESGADYYCYALHGPALLSTCEPASGLRVLDLGCGQGFFTRLLTRQGAKVAGVEIAEQLEPRPTADQAGNHPQLSDWYKLPYFLVFGLVTLDPVLCSGSASFARRRKGSFT